MNRTLKFHLTAVVTLALLSSISAASAGPAYLTAFDGTPGPTASMPSTDGPIESTVAPVDPEVLNELRAYVLAENVVVFEDADGRELVKISADGRAYLTDGSTPMGVSIRVADGKFHAFSLSSALALASEVMAESYMVTLERDGVKREVSLLAVLAQLWPTNVP